MLRRLTLILPLAFVAVFLLFWLMSKMIAPNVQHSAVLERLIAVDFVRPSVRPEQNRLEAEDVDEIPEPKKAPKSVALSAPQLALLPQTQQVFDLDMPILDVNLSIAPPDSLAALDYSTELNVESSKSTSPETRLSVDSLDDNNRSSSFSGNRELMAVRENTLSYPPKAKRRRIEGWVLFNYLVSATGEVVDVEIVESHPPRLFDRVVLKEVRKWKYLPRLVGGEPKPTKVTERKYVFEL